MLRGMVMLAGLLLCPWTVGAEEAGRVLAGPATAFAGDRIRVQGQELRLYGIDALDDPGDKPGDEPESSGRAGAAKLTKVIAGRPLTCSIVSADGPEALCKVGGSEGSDIAAIMVDAGWAAAETSRGLRRIRPELVRLYVRLEVDARAACLGLWRAQPACGRHSRP